MTEQEIIYATEILFHLRSSLQNLTDAIARLLALLEEERRKKLEGEKPQA